MASTFRGLLGEKLGMTQVFDENNRLVPVTVVKAGPCVVTQVRTPEVDGYSAVQLGFGEIDPRKVNKPEGGHFTKAGVTPRRHLVRQPQRSGSHPLAIASNRRAYAWLTTPPTAESRGPQPHRPRLDALGRDWSIKCWRSGGEESRRDVQP